MNIEGINTAEADRLLRLYDSLDRDNLEGSLINALLVKHTSTVTATRDANEILHIKGGAHQNRFRNNSDPGLIKSTLEEQKEESQINEMIRILNSFKLHCNNNKNLSKNIEDILIILLFERGIYGIADKIDFSDESRAKIDSIQSVLLAMKYEALDKVIKHFEAKQLVHHAKVIKEVGLKIFEKAPSESAILDKLRPIETLDKEDIKVLQEGRFVYLDSSSSIKLDQLYKLVDISPRTYQRRRNEFQEALVNTTTDVDYKTINEILLSI